MTARRAMSTVSVTFLAVLLTACSGSPPATPGTPGGVATGTTSAAAPATSSGLPVQQAAQLYSGAEKALMTSLTAVEKDAHAKKVNFTKLHKDATRMSKNAQTYIHLLASTNWPNDLAPTAAQVATESAGMIGFAETLLHAKTAADITSAYGKFGKSLNGTTSQVMRSKLGLPPSA